MVVPIGPVLSLGSRLDTFACTPRFVFFHLSSVPVLTWMACYSCASVCLQLNKKFRLFFIL